MRWTRPIRRFNRHGGLFPHDQQAPSHRGDRGLRLKRARLRRSGESRRGGKFLRRSREPDRRRERGGDQYSLSNPDDDPHLFEASPDTAKALSDAKVVIVNGVDYDPWMEKLLSAHNAPGRKEIIVGKLVGHKAGDNPHLWYDPAYMKAAAKALVADLVAVDPAHKADYEQGEAKFVNSLKPLDDKIATMRKSYAGQPVTASEPVFGYQAGLIGLKVHNEKYALAIMNNAEPTPSEVAAFENDLKGKKVKAMLYNAQASEPAVGKLVHLAKATASRSSASPRPSRPTRPIRIG